MRKMPVVNKTMIVYASGAPSLLLLREDARETAEKLKSQLAEIEAALANAAKKPNTDNTSRAYLRLWKAVNITRL